MNIIKILFRLPNSEIDGKDCFTPRLMIEEDKIKRNEAIIYTKAYLLLGGGIFLLLLFFLSLTSIGNIILNK
jgi:hypothetical protein